MGIIRTFIALEIPARLRETLLLIQRSLMAKTVAVRWIGLDNIHLTLKFLGSTRQEQVPEVCEILNSTAEDFSTFSINITGLGGFPNNLNPKVLWAGIEHDSQLCRFHAKLEAALSKAGFQPEKRQFSPHLTLGRVKDMGGKRQAAAAINDFTIEGKTSFEASKLAFYKSDLQPEGPVYSMLKQIILTK